MASKKGIVEMEEVESQEWTLDDHWDAVDTMQDRVFALTEFLTKMTDLVDRAGTSPTLAGFPTDAAHRAIVTAMMQLQMDANGYADSFETAEKATASEAELDSPSARS